ncbi:MAG: hypothetical protein ACRC8K_04925 [Waterburya sp.]
MQEAVSIYLGGEIITPDLCDYESYKVLGLKCPFCQSPVFYRRSDSYQLFDKVTGEKTGKEVSRKSCFSHFRMDAETGSVCEARSLTTEGRKQIEHLQRKSRGQRLRLFEQHLVELSYINNPSVESIQVLLNNFDSKTYSSKSEKKVIENMNSRFKCLVKSQRRFFKNYCLSIDDGKIKECIHYASEVFPEVSGKMNIIRADFEFQSKAAKEIMHYLGQRASEKQLLDLAKCNFAFAAGTGTGVYFNDICKAPDYFFRSIAENLCLVNWREAINKFNALKATS